MSLYIIKAATLFKGLENVTFLEHSKKRYDTQHNDTQHNDTQHNDTQHNDIIAKYCYAECHI